MIPSRWLFLILLLAALLRFYGLGAESLWLDEALTVKKITLSYPDFIRHFTQETQTILYYLLEKFWCGIVGISEFTLRFPAAICGLLAVYGIFLLARELFSRRTALFSALLMAINPFCLYYSQDARPYSLFLAASVFSLYFGLLLLRRQDWKAGAAYVLCTVAALYAHPLAPLLFGVHVAGFFLFRKSAANPPPRFTGLLKWMFLCGLLYIPQMLLLKRAIFAKTAGTSSASWIPKPNAQAFFQTVSQFFMNPAVLIAGIAVVGLVLLFRYKDLRKNIRKLLYLMAVVTCMMIGPWVISHIISPVYVPRYIIPALTAFVIGLGGGVSALPRMFRYTGFAVLIILTVATLYKYYTLLDKDPWRQTAQALREIVQTGDHVVVTPPFSKNALDFYYKPPEGIPVVTARQPDDILPFRSARRLVLVRSYDWKPNAARDELMNYITGRWFVRSFRSLTAEFPPNPWVYWLTDIRIIVYERPDLPY